MQTLNDLNHAIDRDRKASAYVTYAQFLLLGRSLHDLPPRDEYTRLKAAVAASDDDALRNASAEFVAMVQRRSLLGKMSPYWVPAPPYTPVMSTDEEPSGGFVGPGEAIPPAKVPLTSALTEVAKLASIIAVDRRTLDHQDGRVRQMFERALTNKLVALEDRELLSTTAAVPNERPAGLLADAVDVGVAAGYPSEELAALFAAVRNGNAQAPFLITSLQGAAYLSTGQTNAQPGRVANVPLLTSPFAGDKLILLDAALLVVVDQLLELAAGRTASVEMQDPATNNAVTPIGAATVSGWQTNTAFLRVIRYIWWMLTVPDAVAFLTLGGLTPVGRTAEPARGRR